MRISCKTCRRLGESICGRGEKCASVKKPYPPGIRDSDRKHRGSVSEFVTQLREKQKVRNTYGLREKQFSSYVKEASSKSGVNPVERLYENLESRLDNVAYRLGFATARSIARQMVSHGHITVNGKRMNIPSYRVKLGDVLAIREGSKSKVLFTGLAERLEKYKTPVWANMDIKHLKGNLVANPKLTEGEVTFNLASVIEFYSR
ncbi:MAG: 30S ribosomal protein S4 [Candidatus Yonathbacteria bacterium]|nr:30S ribosomal protein S4 [Candidatus Yonathbacteria bacterium]